MASLSIGPIERDTRLLAVLGDSLAAVSGIPHVLAVLVAGSHCGPGSYLVVAVG